MRLINKIIQWFQVSNHFKHFICGLVLTIFSIILFIVMNINYMNSIFISNILVLLCMCTAEYKDYKYGQLFDWEDILAGILCPLIVWLISIIYILWV